MIFYEDLAYAIMETFRSYKLRFASLETKNPGYFGRSTASRKENLYPE